MALLPQRLFSIMGDELRRLGAPAVALVIVLIALAIAAFLYFTSPI
jgi:hypothetical protein